MNDRDGTISFVGVTSDLIEEWLDSFDPSVKTFASNFSINTLKKYNFDFDKIADSNDRHFAELLSRHLLAFLKLKEFSHN